MKPYLLASAGQPSLHGYNARMFYWIQEASRRNCRHKYGETSFQSFLGFSVESEFKGAVLGTSPLASLDWDGPAPWAIPLFSAFLD